MNSIPKFRPDSIRLKDYDYALAGAYFVTICIQNRECILGRIEDGTMLLSEHGRIEDDCWYALPEHYSNVFLDQFTVMPNHVHGIVLLTETGDVGARSSRPHPTKHVIDEPGGITPPLRRHSLGQIIGYFKYQSTKRMNDIDGFKDRKIWQRNYHDRIIRNETELKAIREYILNNPYNWDKDIENPLNVNKKP
ncbi:MAG: transposase [FCB group bacterium]|nr:transposase [FCB group bacterium]